MTQATQKLDDEASMADSNGNVDKLTELLKTRARRLRIEHQIDYLVSQQFPNLFYTTYKVGFYVSRDFSADDSYPHQAKEANLFTQQLLEIAEKKPELIEHLIIQHLDALSNVEAQKAMALRAHWKDSTKPQQADLNQSHSSISVENAASPLHSSNTAIIKREQYRKTVATGVKWPQKVDALTQELVPIIEEMLRNKEPVLPRTVWQKLVKAAKPGQTIFGFTGEKVKWLSRSGDPQELSFEALNGRLKTILTYD